MASALRLALGDARPLGTAVARVPPALDGSGTPCYHEFVQLMQCLTSHRSTVSCKHKMVALRECLEGIGL